MLTPEREHEIREVARMGDWDGEPRAVSLTKCVRDAVGEIDLLRAALQVAAREAAGGNDITYYRLTAALRPAEEETR